MRESESGITPSLPEIHVEGDGAPVLGEADLGHVEHVGGDVHPHGLGPVLRPLSSVIVGSGQDAIYKASFTSKSKNPRKIHFYLNTGALSWSLSSLFQHL